MEDKQIRRKKIKGVIVSDKMDKTRVILVQRFVKHKKYGKYLKIDKKFKAHDEKNEYKKGDKVVIGECKPISRDKHFVILNKIKNFPPLADQPRAENIL